jgi:hypothetical protein
VNLVYVEIYTVWMRCDLGTGIGYCSRRIFDGMLGEYISYIEY